MRTFLIIWLGQLISMIGSGLTGFALGVWIFDQTGQALPFALTALFSQLPRVALAPIAGALADRWNRRLVMILADSGAALATLFAAIMLFFFDLQIWHIYLIAFLSSTFGAFQEPAYTASVTMLVPKQHLGRASGLMQAAQAIESLVTPLLAALLFAAIDLSGIILIDFATFFVAIGALLIVHIPQPERVEAAQSGRSSLGADIAFGWRYLVERPGLFAMLVYFALVNFLLNAVGVLMGPMVLAFAPVTALGVVQMTFGVGLLAGSVVMSVWGGPKRRMWGVYGAIAVLGLGFMVAGLRPQVWTVALGIFILMAALPTGSGSSQAIWQTKIAPGVQGRVFAMRAFVSRSMMPVGYLLGGLLADHVFNPLLLADGALASTWIGQIVGVGPGRGIGLMLVLSGALVIAVTGLAMAYPRMRRVEDELPDAIPDAPEAVPAEPLPEAVSAPAC
jgi:MFS family permease